MHKILLTINVSFCAAFCGFLQKKMYGLNCVTRESCSHQTSNIWLVSHRFATPCSRKFHYEGGGGAGCVVVNEKHNRTKVVIQTSLSKYR